MKNYLQNGGPALKRRPKIARYRNGTFAETRNVIDLCICAISSLVLSGRGKRGCRGCRGTTGWRPDAPGTPDTSINRMTHTCHQSITSTALMYLVTNANVLTKHFLSRCKSIERKGTTKCLCDNEKHFVTGTRQPLKLCRGPFMTPRIHVDLKKA